MEAKMADRTRVELTEGFKARAEAAAVAMQQERDTHVAALACVREDNAAQHAGHDAEAQELREKYVTKYSQQKKEAQTQKERDAHEIDRLDHDVKKVQTACTKQEQELRKKYAEEQLQ